MNCRKSQQAIGQRHDGRLAPGAAARLDAHLATCAACRAFAAGLDVVGAQLRAQVVPPGPTPEAAWVGVQRAIRLQQEQRTPGTMWTPQPWLRWAGAAALILFVAGGGLLWQVRPRAPSARLGLPALPAAAEVLSVSTELADAATMVYEDAETGMAVVWVLPAEEGNHARM